MIGIFTGRPFTKIAKINLIHQTTWFINHSPLEQKISVIKIGRISQNMTNQMSHDMCFLTMCHFDTSRLRGARAASFEA